LQKGPTNFKELNFRLEDESKSFGYNLCISQRSLQRDINDIRNLFGIDIRNDKKRNVYYIVEDDETDPTNIRLLESYEMMDALRTTKNYMPYVYFESRKPAGMENFYILLRAAKEHKTLRFKYQKYYEQNIDTKTVHPYAIKESRGRWYLVARDLKDEKVKTFGLDRISTPIELLRPFKGGVPDIDINFRYCFGIINPVDILPEKVSLLFTHDQGQYIQTYPLHHSQQLISEDTSSGEMTFELQIKITYDFIMELLSFSEDLEVLRPKSLAIQIKNIYKNTLGYYE
jgi:predicted DNA-binding transcriptional regulator YafY